MNIKELKEKIKDLPDNMPIAFSTFSTYVTREISVEPYYANNNEWVNEDTLLICAENFTFSETMKNHIHKKI